MAPDLELGLTLWIGGAIGVAAIMPIVPQLAKGKTKLSPAALIAVSFVQSGVLLALAIWAGIAFAPRTGLSAPVVSDLIARRGIASLSSALISGSIGALIGGAILLAAAAYVRNRLPAPSMKFEPPLSARLLYGGITEELLLRWGVMSVLAWLGARMTHQSFASQFAIWIAILASALLFAIGHLPAARTVFGGLTAKVVGYVLVANSAFGVMAGFLFWRYGIESAMVAHAGAHAIGAAFDKSGTSWGAR